MFILDLFCRTQIYRAPHSNTLRCTIFRHMLYMERKSSTQCVRFLVGAFSYILKSPTIVVLSFIHFFEMTDLILYKFLLTLHNFTDSTLRISSIHIFNSWTFQTPSKSLYGRRRLGRSRLFLCLLANCWRYEIWVWIFFVSKFAVECERNSEISAIPTEFFF